MDSAMSKQGEVVLFASTAIALYGYDQGMMSLINTNQNYLSTMGVAEEDTMVAVIVSVYYIGTAVGSVLASKFADRKGRKASIFACLLVTVLGNLMMFVSGFGFTQGARSVMLAGRVVMGLGVGGLDSVIPTYSSELSESDERGKSLAQEFQANILGLVIAFGINVLVTQLLGKQNQWAWRIPIVAMQVFPVMLLAVITRLPESPRWSLAQDREDEAKESLKAIYGEEEFDEQFEDLKKATEDESSKPVYITEMLKPGKEHFHPTIITIMGQVNQALTGYGAISVYGPQIFELLGFGVNDAEYITLGNYVSYLLFMTFAWMYIDVVGRRRLMLLGSVVLIVCFLLLALFAGLNMQVIPKDNFLAGAVPGSVILYIATAAFGIGWLPQPWLIPTEIYPSSARANGAAISVVVWGIMNFAVTFLTPILFNNLEYWLFIVFAVTNLIAGALTWLYSPETGGRSFEENLEFFDSAKDEGSWIVKKVDKGKFLGMPKDDEKGGDEESGERQPLLSRS